MYRHNPVDLPGTRSTPHGVGSVIAECGKDVGQTCQCAHCGMHFLFVAGSGRTRGWCMGSKTEGCPGGITCGRPMCDHPMPHWGWKKKLEKHNSNPALYPLD